MSLSSARPRFEVRVIDVEGQIVQTADVLAKRTPQEGGVKFAFDEIMKAWIPEQLEPGPWLLSVSDKTGHLESQTQERIVTERGLQTLFILGRPGLPFYYRGGAKVPFDPEKLGERVGVSMKPGMEERAGDLAALAREMGLEPEDAAPDADRSRAVAPGSQSIHKLLEPFRPKFTRLSTVKVADSPTVRPLWIFTAPDEQSAEAFERRVSTLPFVAQAGKVVHRKGQNLSFVTNEIVVALRPGVDIKDLVQRADGFTLVRQIKYAGNSFLLRAPQLTSSELLKVCNRLAQDPSVISAEPNLVSSVSLHFTPNDFAGQLHHPIIRSEGAWDIVRANTRDTPVIAVIDEGCDVTHPDFVGTLQDQINWRDLTSTLFSSPHGTMTAGVAAAVSNNGLGIAGVAGTMHFIAVQYPLGMGDQDYADMFVWCAGEDPGNPDRAIPAPPSPGASVISNSWGLGEDRPLHFIVSNALNHVTTASRNQKGCVVVFAAGNQGDDLAIRQPWAAHPNVIAVGSSTIDTDLRVVNSNFGSALDLTAPGGDNLGATYSTTAGVGSQIGTPGEYDVLGETSCACPQVAGVATLMLAVNPNLSAAEVRDILQTTARKIDSANAAYDSDGHSDLYGYGCLDALAAVQEALRRFGS